MHKDAFSTSLPTSLSSSDFLITVILTGMNWYLTVVLICIAWWLVMLRTYSYTCWSLLCVFWENVMVFCKFCTLSSFLFFSSWLNSVKRFILEFADSFFSLIKYVFKALCYIFSFHSLYSLAPGFLGSFFLFQCVIQQLQFQWGHNSIDHMQLSQLRSVSAKLWRVLGCQSFECPWWWWGLLTS